MDIFHYDNGLFLTRAGLGVDVRRRQPRCFVSHAHADHMARHEMAWATPATGRLYRHRLGARHRVREMEYRQPAELGSLRLTAYPAGHCLGSAMLLADDGDTSLLYTGDFKLGPSATSVAAELPSADILVMESTFGRPDYRLPAREDTIAQLVETDKNQGIVCELADLTAQRAMFFQPELRAQGSDPLSASGLRSGRFGRLAG